jgi:hypothetical protein
MFRTALISMFLTSTALATTWTVDDDGKADFDNIQAAVDAASDASDRHGMQQSSSVGGPWSKNHNFYLRYSTQKKSPSTIPKFRN